MTKTPADIRFEEAFFNARSNYMDDLTEEFRIDSKGRKVHVYTKNNPLTYTTVKEFYTGVRVVDEEECLEVLGYNGFRTQVANGNLLQHGVFYWITTRAAKAYNLVRPTVGGVCCNFMEV